MPRGAWEPAEAKSVTLLKLFLGYVRLGYKITELPPVSSVKIWDGNFSDPEQLWQ
jgi:hypothetical protein